MRDGRAAGVSINVLYHPYTHAKARGRSPTYTLTYNTLNMTIWRKVTKTPVYPQLPERDHRASRERVRSGRKGGRAAEWVRRAHPCRRSALSSRRPPDADLYRGQQPVIAQRAPSW